MSLPALEWRKLPIRTATASYTSGILLNTIYDMLTGSVYIDGTTRTVGSGSAWSASFKFTTGSNTEAVYCRPPLNTVVSQSVIFATRTNTPASSSAVPIAGAFDGAFTSSVVHAACVKNASGSITEWTSQFPFGSGSYSTGYHKAFGPGHFASGSKITIYESKEAIAVFIVTGSAAIVGSLITVGSLIAGAIIDPETDVTQSSADCERDGRIYGIATTSTVVGGTTAGFFLNAFFNYSAGTTSTPGTFLSGTTDATTAVNNFSKFSIIAPNQNAVYAPAGIIGGNLNYFFITSSLAVTYSGSVTRSGSLAQIPLFCMETTNVKYLGRLRDIVASRAQFNNTIVKNPSGTVVGYAVSAPETTVINQNTVLLKYS
jgi:hypothetical protein